MCGAIALGMVSDAGVSISYGTILSLATLGWFMIVVYAAYRVSIYLVQKRRGEALDNRERFFEVLNGAYDIKDRLKLLEKDAERNLNRIHKFGDEEGFYVKPD
jgi:hypothetical protein